MMKATRTIEEITHGKPLAANEIRIRSMRGGRRPQGPQEMRLDRASPYGNPFRLEREDDRAAVVLKHRRWMLERCLEEAKPYTQAALKALTETPTWLCWCAPLPCHLLNLRDAAVAAVNLEAGAYHEWCRNELDKLAW